MKINYWAIVLKCLWLRIKQWNYGRIFLSKVKRVNYPSNTQLYSVEVYNDTHSFSNFNPETIFEKWAAIEADVLVNPSDDLQTLVLPTGSYAIFIQKGPAADGQKTYEFIFNTWLPHSDYMLDNRPHFALMGDKYKNNAVDSEQEIWIPIQERN